jgi:hypothetical protein
MQGEGILAERSSPPYSLSVADLAEGCYSVSVRAFDDAGWIGQTEPVDVSVGANCGQAPYLMRPAPIPGVVEAEYFDLGGQGVGYSDLDQANTGTGIRSDEGVDIEGISGAGGAYGVINIGSRDWMEYTIEVAEPGLYSAKVRVASDNGGSFEILVDGVSKTGTVDILPTGGPDVYLNAILNFALDAGVHVLRYRGRAPGVNVDKIEFTYLGPTSTTEGKGAARFHVDEAFPNPTATEASFAVRLSQPGQLDVTVYDIRGRLVARPFSGRAATGERDVSIDVSHLRPGVYLVRVAVDDEVAVRRIVVAAH